MDQTPARQARQDWRKYAGTPTCRTGRAARMLQCSKSTVLRMIERGQLYGMRDKGLTLPHYRVYIRQVEDIMALRQAEAIRYAIAVTGQSYFEFI